MLKIRNVSPFGPIHCAPLRRDIDAGEIVDVADEAIAAQLLAQPTHYSPVTWAEWPEADLPAALAERDIKPKKDATHEDLVQLLEQHDQALAAAADEPTADTAEEPEA